MPTKASAKTTQSASKGKKNAAGKTAEADAPAPCDPAAPVVGVVLTAAAAMSHNISIVGWNPPRTSPENALGMTLGELGILDLEEFREMLVSLLPENARDAIAGGRLGMETRLEDVVRLAPADG